MDLIKSEDPRKGPDQLTTSLSKRKLNEGHIVGRAKLHIVSPLATGGSIRSWGHRMLWSRGVFGLYHTTTRSAIAA
jgi:hypothetical protein